MMKFRTVFSGIAAGALLSGCAPDAPEPTSPPPPPAETTRFEHARPVTDMERMMSVIGELSSDEYGGREPVSEGERLTVEFIESRFRDMGLHPLFGNSYRQPVQLVSIAAEPATVRMSFRFQERDRIVEFADEMMLGTVRAVPESSVEGSEVVFVGYGIVAPEYDWNDYADIDVEGKTVLILVNDPGFATQDPSLFRGNAMTYYGRWTYKYEEAARQGAAAAIVIHEDAPAGYGWEVVRNSGNGPQFHRDDGNANMDHLPIEAWIQHDVASEIVAAAGLDLATLEQRARTRGFRAVPLGSTMDASVQNTIAHNRSYNVGALLRGSERPGELFIYVAHWDHLGTKSAAPGEDAIYNGAVDNATGIAALLELARSFAALPRPPERSVAFLAVTAEESGLLGSAQYAESPPIPMHRTIAGINMDSLRVYGPTHDVVVVGYGNSELEDILREKAARQNRVIEPEEYPERGYYYRSDHFNFAKKGVPMLYAEAGSEHTELGAGHIEARDAEYLKKRYHTPLDEIEDDWDLRGMVQDIELYFAVGLEIADSEVWPNWYEGNEFRSIRDRSLDRQP